MKTKTKMYAKNILVSFLVIVSFLALTASVAAGDIASSNSVKVNGFDPYSDVVSVIAGETITVKVFFTAAQDDTYVTVEAEIEGEKVKSDAMTKPFDVEENKSYRKVLNIKVPYELKDEISDDITLNIQIDGKEYKTELDEITLRVQRPSYNTDIKSVTVSEKIEAGETFPVDIVLKNTGYNNLDDVYVAVSISELGIKKTSYFGDLVALECDKSDADTEFPWSDDTLDRNCNEDDEDTVSGRLYLKVPYGAASGIYTLEVEVKNDDMVNSVVKQVIIKNDFTSNVIASSLRKSAAVGENAEYSLLIVNPTDKLKVYRIVAESSEEVTSSASEAVVAVPAGSSKTITISASAGSEGEHSFDVSVLSGEELVGTVSLNLIAEGAASRVTSPIVVLTVILAIVFLVLLIVLIVLIGKKPEKAEEFGESYY